MTIESNLVISCIKCNKEKDYLTFEEYKSLKQKQAELRQSLDFTNIIDNVLLLYNEVIDIAKNINLDYQNAEKNLHGVEYNILSMNFNAYQGYLLAKSLKDAIEKRDYLKLLNDAYSALHSLIGTNKKQLIAINEKIVDDTLSNQYKQFKEKCMKDFINPQNKTIIDLSIAK